MVTTIKITCDGVFIQTNSTSNRIHATNNDYNDRIETDSSMNVINGTNGRLSNGHNHNSNDSNHNRIVSGENTKYSINVDDDDIAPQSLPNLPIDRSQPALISPQLVKTLSRIKKTTTSTSLSSTANINKIVINSLSPSSVAVNKSIHKVIRIDKNGQCTTSIKSDSRQWDGCTSKKNGIIVNNVTGVRRRNTFKNYLIECKENIVRRLSSPTSPIG